MLDDDTADEKSRERKRGRRVAERPRRSARRWSAKLLVIVILVVGVAGGMLAQRAYDVVGRLVPGLPGLFDDGEQTIDSSAIASSFTGVAELTVEEYNFTNVGEFTEADKKLLGIPIPFTGKSFLITYSGTVEAGIEDFTAISVGIDETARTVTIAIPPVEVLGTEIEPGSIKVYDESSSALNQLQVEDFAAFQETEEKRATQVAVNNGLLTKAENRAESIIKSHVETLLAGTAYVDYTITVVRGTADAAPSTR